MEPGQNYIVRDQWISRLLKKAVFMTQSGTRNSKDDSRQLCPHAAQRGGLLTIMHHLLGGYNSNGDWAGIP